MSSIAKLQVEARTETFESASAASLASIYQKALNTKGVSRDRSPSFTGTIVLDSFFLDALLRHYGAQGVRLQVNHRVEQVDRLCQGDANDEATRLSQAGL